MSSGSHAPMLLAPQWRTRLFAFAGAVLAIALGVEVANESFLWPAVGLGALAAIVLIRAQPLPLATLLLGGAMFGSSVAWFLADNADFKGSILVVEKDPSYEFTSTAHTNSCMRQQFSREINVRISQFAADFVSNFQHYMGDDPRVQDGAAGAPKTEAGVSPAADSPQAASRCACGHGNSAAQRSDSAMLMLSSTWFRAVAVAPRKR